MEHPGVKALLDRLFKQNGGHMNKQSVASSSTQGSEINPKLTANDGLTIVFNEPVKKKKNDENCQSSNNAFTNFKENLKQRMKARRQEMRKEEEEDDLLNEEYHDTLKKSNGSEESDEDSEDSGEELEAEKKTKKISISDDEDEDEDEDRESEDEDTFGKDQNKTHNSDGDSDNDFQLNLNDDDDEEEESESELVLVKNNNNKKSKLKKSNGKDKVYEFDEDDDTNDEVLNCKNTKSVTSLNGGGDIPLTNTIPSNQPKGDYDFYSQEYLEGTQFLIDKQQRRSLDEITNISFNYETTQQLTHNASSNTINSLKSKASSTTNLTILNQSDEANDGIDEDFDELAMLCSGQFKEKTQNDKSSPKIDLSKLIEIEETTKKDDTKTDYNLQKNKEVLDVSLKNDDLYAADDPDEDEEVIKKADLFLAEKDKNSNSNDAVSKTNESSEEDNDDSEDDEEIESKKKKKKKVIDDMEGEDDSKESQNKDEVEKKVEKTNAFDKLKKQNLNESLDEDEKIERQGFFEQEAELSGSEEENDENYDGDSNEEEMVCSGDEDEFEKDELQDQLGKIYLKDQIDEDKRQIRLFKEMYMGAEEAEKKADRKKQFRWKNTDNYNTINRFSSEEEGDDDDEDDEDPTSGPKNNEKYMKLMENRNWRMIRHEREQFVKLKANAKTLLSDDELQEIESKKNKKKKKTSHNHHNDYNNDSDDIEYIDKSDSGEDDEDSDDTTQKKTDFKPPNSILSMGQHLLKKQTLNKSEQNKRGLNGEINAISRLVPTTSETTNKADNTEPQTKTSLTSADPENLLKKFSFLNKDKGYLSKLSNYVNKNFINTDNSRKQGKTGTNGMVFTKIDLTNDDDDNDSDSRVPKPEAKAYINASAVNKSSNAINNSRAQEDSGEATTSKITITPTPKRTKYDTCESIFNHIN